MTEFADIAVHCSQWPDSLAAQLRESLHNRSVPPKFHYMTPPQVRHWLRLHEALSPARHDPQAQQIYAAAFAPVAGEFKGSSVQVVGLGCGGGQKEAALLKALSDLGCRMNFTAVDVSVGMVLATLQAAWQHVPPAVCSGLVCDLALMENLDAFLRRHTAAPMPRIVTFFGMIPNLDPRTVPQMLGQVLRPDDTLLCSANLAPGPDYRRGVEVVLPQYDNALTREWLFILLRDLGAEPDDGRIQFRVEETAEPDGLLRVVADWTFRRDCRWWVEESAVEFKRGETLRLFYSFRHTQATLARTVAPLKPDRQGSWINAGGEEGVFWYRRTA